jgi:hypothetical protein
VVECELDARSADEFVELVAELAGDLVKDHFDVPTDEDVAYERAQASEAWQRMGGGGL